MSERLHEDDIAAVLDTLRSGWLTMGPRIQALEAAFAEWTGCAHAAAVSNHTAALYLACRALGVGAGDEVIVPAVGSRAAADTPRRLGAEPVFCDVVSPRLPNLDVSDVERRIGDRTKAVIAVHAFGYPADARLLREICDARGLALVEDCRHAIGATLDHHGRQAGTVGDLACFSFGPGCQLAVGEGGMVASGRDDLAAKVKSLRSHAMTSGTWDRHRGHQDSYDIVDIGFNFRMDEPRAALASSRLDRLREEIEGRRTAASTLRSALAGTPGLEPCWEREDVARASHLALPLLFADGAARERAAQALSDLGLMPCVEPLLGPGAPRAEEFSVRHLGVPLGAELEPGRVAAALAY